MDKANQTSSQSTPFEQHTLIMCLETISTHTKCSCVNIKTTKICQDYYNAYLAAKSEGPLPPCLVPGTDPVAWTHGNDYLKILELRKHKPARCLYECTVVQFRHDKEAGYCGLDLETGECLKTTSKLKSFAAEWADSVLRFITFGD
jgi:hypothetical protein